MPLNKAKLKMGPCVVWWYLIVLILLEVAVKTQMTAHGGSHGSLQETLLDGMSYNFQELAADGFSPDEDEQEEDQSLSFEPRWLSFGVSPLSEPQDARVLITNRGNASVHFIAVSASSANFHSSFFEEKVVHPGGNTSFNIVFLGRERGYTETDLFIHTSVGVHKYKVSGTSIPNAYRLHPLVGMKLPLNASISPLIYMHNPHDYALQITEMYCSGGAISLELPDGESEGPQSMWRLPPRSTRPVIALRYTQPRITIPGAATHTAYLRIKVNDTSPLLVVAVEVTPGSETGPYLMQPNIDFGMGGTKDPPTQVRLFMGNSSPKWLRVASISVHPGLSVEAAADASEEISSARGIRVGLLSTAQIAPYKQTLIGTLSIDWRTVFDADACCGSIVIKMRSGGHKVVVPYTSQALHGGLTYNHTLVRFRSSDVNLSPLRALKMTNEFNVGVYVTELEIADNLDKYFEVDEFKPKAIAPSKSTNIFTIRLKNWTDKLKFQTKITVRTNITSLVIPIYIYNGKFDIVLSIPPPASDPDLLDFGLVGTSSTTRATVLLVNTNPIPICVSTYGIKLEGGALQFMGCAKNHGDEKITACTCVSPGSRGVGTLTAVAPTRETANLLGVAWVTTDHHNQTFNIRLSVAKGRLALAKPIVLEDCFAGTICSHPLRVMSHFYKGMDVVSVNADPPDKRFYLSPDKSSTGLITPRETSHLGNICYDPTVKCSGECYTGIDFNSTVGRQWLMRLSLQSDTLASDVELVNARYKLFLDLIAKYPRKNITLKMDTTNVRLHTFPAATLEMSWPYIATSQFIPIYRMDAPLVQVGTERVLAPHLPISNPSNSKPLLVQLIVDWMLPYYSSVEQPPPLNLHKELIPPDCAICSNAPSGAFHFIKTSKESLTELPKEFESFVVHPDSKVFILEPGETVNVTLGFTALDANKVTSMLFIRNNLTVIEAIRLTGQGAYPSFRFGNRRPGSNAPLLFEVTEKHLKDCDKSKKLTPSTTNLTVKRTFTARNTGDIVIVVKNFFINGLECEGYGYKVLNCQGFTLHPNSTRKIDIAFTPDFTLSKIHRMLILETSLHTPVNFSLLTTLPSHLLAQCRDSLPRPPWEHILQIYTFYTLLFIGICVCFFALYEAERILTTVPVRTVDRNSSDALLDLKSIGQNKSWETNYSAPEESKSTLQKSIYEDNVPHQRAKKKVAKQKSAPNMETNEVKKAAWLYVNRPKETQQLTKPPDEQANKKSTNTHLYNNNNNNNNNKKQKTRVASFYDDETAKVKRLSPPCCEEDTSSTTTESSNNDEADKENDGSTTSSSKSSSTSSSTKKIMTTTQNSNKKKQSSQYKDNYEGDGEDEEYDHTHKLKSKENVPPSKSKSAEKLKTISETEKFVPNDKSKTLKASTSKRDKQALAKKRSLDKSFVFVPKPEPAPVSATTSPSPVTVPVPMNCWTENKASFSDVVARSDTYSNIVAPRTNRPQSSQNQVSSLYTESKSNDLGPIGFQPKNPWSILENTKPPIRPIAKPQSSSSFFFYNGRSAATEEKLPKTVGVISKPPLNPIERPSVYSLASAYADDPLMQPLEEIPTYDDEQTLLQSSGLTGRISKDVLKDDMSTLKSLKDYECPWDLPQSNVGYSGMSDMYDTSAYRMRNVYTEPNTAWTSSQGLWDPPVPAAPLLISDKSPKTTASPVTTSNVYRQGTVPADNNAAEWLWGYNGGNSANSVNPLNGIGQLGTLNSALAPPGLTRPTQDQAAFDPFRSLSSIWSPAWTERWGSAGSEEKKDNPKK